jgi:exodeoxyribonuclease VII large subunit
MTPSPAIVSSPDIGLAALEEKKVYSVSTVVHRADQVIREKARPLWVRGEVSGWKQYPTGHCYFTIKDDRAELCCTLWAGAARRLPALPSNGMMIEVFGQLGVYARRGRFQMEVARLETTAAGGLWQVARDRLTARLREEGLLDEDRKRSLPAHPDRVGIVTSAQSAALQDMLRALRRKAWWMSSLVSHCSVEGAHAAPEIAAAIRRFGTSRDRRPVDVVIVARGGGSMESLWAFNMEEVARAIAACPVPVISAVGHETDYTVADAVADVRAATPTAGAEMAVPDGRQILARIDDFRQTSRLRVTRSHARGVDALLGREDEVRRAMQRRLTLLQTRAAAAAQHLEARSPRQQLRQAAEQTDQLTRDLHTGMERRLRRLASDIENQVERLHESAAHRQESLEQTLAVLAEALDARSPLRVLARGYSLVHDAETGRVIRRSEHVRAEQRLRIRLVDGEFAARVQGEILPDAPVASDILSPTDADE